MESDFMDSLFHRLNLFSREFSNFSYFLFLSLRLSKLLFKSLDLPLRDLDLLLLNRDSIDDSFFLIIETTQLIL
jgi:hypothetical protein